MRIHRIEGFRYEGSKYDVIEVQVVADPRDIANQGYKLFSKKEKPGTELMLVTPLLEAGLWMDGTSYSEISANNNLNAKGLNEQSCKDAEAIASTAYKKVTKKERRTLLKFSSEMSLTDRPFVPFGKSTEKLQLVMAPKFTTYKNPFDASKSLSLCKATWRIIDLNSEQDLTLDTEEDAAAAELKRLMGNVGM